MLFNSSLSHTSIIVTDSWVRDTLALANKIIYIPYRTYVYRIYTVPLVYCMPRTHLFSQYNVCT